MTLRISTTWLESFRRVLETDYGSEEELIAQIQGKPFTPTWQMEAGSAWHDVVTLTNLPDKDDHLYQSGGFLFSGADITRAQRFIGPGLREVKAVRPWLVGGHDCAVVAQVDHIRGVTNQEHKCRFGSAPDCRNYEPSLQWRFYLAIHGASVVRYNLFHFAEPRNPPPHRLCVLKDVLTCRFWRYPELEQDCDDWLRRFVAWAEDRGLVPALEANAKAKEDQCKSVPLMTP